MNPLRVTTILLIVFTIFALFYGAPVSANKFETIGSGVSGSFKIKVEYLRLFAYTISGLFFVSSLLSVFTNKRNAHELNYTAWKPSALIFFTLSIAALIAAFML